MRTAKRVRQQNRSSLKQEITSCWQNPKLPRRTFKWSAKKDVTNTTRWSVCINTDVLLVSHQHSSTAPQWALCGWSKKWFYFEKPFSSGDKKGGLSYPPSVAVGVSEWAEEKVTKQERDAIHLKIIKLRWCVVVVVLYRDACLRKRKSEVDRLIRV